jgi:glutaconyl-CoA/methylmalonyl-CoA decarboxylase subunit gamma
MKVHVKIGDRIFDVDIESINTRPIIARVEGEEFEVWPENGIHDEGSEKPAVVSSEKLTVQAAPPPAAAGGNEKLLVAPLPGTIIEVFVKPGEYVETGHVVLVIEAMKMKNSIRSVRSGKVAAVLVSAGQTVMHKQPLLEFEA